MCFFMFLYWNLIKPVDFAVLVHTQWEVKIVTSIVSSLKKA